MKVTCKYAVVFKNKRIKKIKIIKIVMTAIIVYDRCSYIISNNTEYI